MVIRRYHISIHRAEAIDREYDDRYDPDDLYLPLYLFSDTGKDTDKERCSGYPKKDTEDKSSELDMYTLKRVKMDSPASLVKLLEMSARGQLGELARIKGVVKCGDTWLRFDAADGLYSITGVQEKDPETQCVFIGNTIDRTKIDSMFVHTGLRRKNNIISLALPVSSRKSQP